MTMFSVHILLDSFLCRHEKLSNIVKTWLYIIIVYVSAIWASVILHHNTKTYSQQGFDFF